jgi:hypothetical protein
MMLKMSRVFMVLCSFMVAIASASAQDLQDSPLRACPGYLPYHSAISDITWSANCFLHALLREDKILIAALSKLARCEKPAECDGPIDAVSARFAFGEGEPWDGAGEGTKSLRALIKGAEHVIMTVYHVPTQTMKSDRTIVLFIPRPGPASGTLGGGWMKNLFECDFEFDEDLRVWVIAGFCASESDVISGSDVAYKTKIDLNARDADFPIMIWRPAMSK